MEKYIGVKIIEAKKIEEGTNKEGYKVKYPDGYTSWSPTKVFEEAYRRIDGMTFGLAIEAMKKGCSVARKGWNGKDQFIYLMEGSDMQKVLKYGYGEYVGEPTIVDTLAIKTTSNQIQIGWLASQTDMLAEDWYIVE